MIRHEFLAALHEALRPGVYLEIGVAAGDSLRLAQASSVAIGVDPLGLEGNASVLRMTSDEFFAEHTSILEGAPVDLAFIDGMHLFEYALRDFIGIERLSHPATVVLIDDALPHERWVATRGPNPYSWTGDVWRIEPILHRWRPDLQIIRVDTSDVTGVLLVCGLDPASTRLQDAYDEILAEHPLDDVLVPVDVLERHGSISPEEALADIVARVAALQAGD